MNAKQQYKQAWHEIRWYMRHISQPGANYRFTSELPESYTQAAWNSYDLVENRNSPKYPRAGDYYRQVRDQVIEYRLFLFVVALHCTYHSKKASTCSRCNQLLEN